MTDSVKLYSEMLRLAENSRRAEKNLAMVIAASLETVQKRQL